MTTPRVADIVTYLRDTGWRERPDGWRGASIWFRPDTPAGDRELLVPPRDDMGDSDLRVRDILDALTTVENRPGDEIARDIDSPLVDTQSYRTFPDDLPSGLTTVAGGLRALQGVRDVLVASARTVLEGPHLAFRGSAPRSAADLLRLAQLGPSLPGSYVLTVRVPVDEPESLFTAAPPFGRRVLVQMHDAVAAVRDAVAASGEGRDLAVFDDTVTAGVSADLCSALSDLAGTTRRQPFDVAFRWARGRPAQRPPMTMTFGAESGALIRSAAERLRRLEVSGPATITGVIESLHDDPPGRDRWRIRVRGDLIRGTATGQPDGSRRSIWVRLGGQQEYDQAIAAHRTRQTIRAAGELATVDGRIELLVSHDAFAVLA
jgi:hypothetical protein